MTLCESCVWWVNETSISTYWELTKQQAALYVSLLLYSSQPSFEVGARPAPVAGEEREGEVFIQGHTASKQQTAHVEQNLFWPATL